MSINRNRQTTVCIRCWRRRPQVGHWCQPCFDEMHEIARLGDGDPHTCQAPECGNLTAPGHPLCDGCEAFYTGEGVRE